MPRFSRCYKPSLPHDVNHCLQTKQASPWRRALYAMTRIMRVRCAVILKLVYDVAHDALPNIRNVLFTAATAERMKREAACVDGRTEGRICRYMLQFFLVDVDWTAAIYEHNAQHFRFTIVSGTRTGRRQLIRTCILLCN